MTRFGAFGIHLGISLLIFAVLGYLILFHWYPDFFFASDGGWQGIRIVAFVDLVLGPTLTLVVFNPTKPARELTQDLSIIAAIQISCLAAGTYVVYSERPIAMVYSDGTFYSMTEDDYLDAGQQVPDLAQMDKRNPPWVSVVLPSDPEAQSRIRGSAIKDRVPLRALAQHYEPFSPEHIDPQRDGLTMDRLRARNQNTTYLDEFLKKHGGSFDEWVFLQFGTRYLPALLAMRSETDELIYLEMPSKADAATDSTVIAPDSGASNGGTRAGSPYS